MLIERPILWSQLRKRFLQTSTPIRKLAADANVIHRSPYHCKIIESPEIMIDIGSNKLIELQIGMCPLESRFDMLYTVYITK